MPPQLLGFLKIEEGDAAITPSGTEFANSEILRQKELFRDAAVENVLLLRQIRRALEAKSDHTVPEDFFLDMLDEQFSEEECLRQMETAVTWGRYAELFDFDAGAAPLYLARRAGRRDCRQRGGRVKQSAPPCPLPCHCTHMAFPHRYRPWRSARSPCFFRLCRWGPIGWPSRFRRW